MKEKPLSEHLLKVFNTMKEAGKITYADLAKKVGYNRTSIGSIVCKIKNRGYDTDKYIIKKKRWETTEKKAYKIHCKNCGKETTTTNLTIAQTGLCHNCRNEPEKTSEMDNNKITVSLEDGIEISIPLKKQMTAEEFIEMSGKIQKIKGLSSGPRIVESVMQEGISQDLTTSGWTENEIQFLVSNFGKIPTYRIATKLGRTNLSIEKKAYRMGLSKLPDQKANIYLKKKRGGRIRLHQSEIFDTIKRMNERGKVPQTRDIRKELGLPKKFTGAIATHVWALERIKKLIKHEGEGYVIINHKNNNVEKPSGPVSLNTDEEKQEKMMVLLQDCVDGKKITFKDARMTDIASTPEEWQSHSQKVIENTNNICELLNTKGEFIFTPDFCLIFKKEG